MDDGEARTTTSQGVEEKRRKIRAKLRGKK
jgi:hypothetical protein